MASLVAAGELVLVLMLRDYEPPALPIQVVNPKSRRVPAKVRIFVDFLVERLGANPALQPDVQRAR